MANIISKAEITLTWVIDVAANMRYYKLQSSTASAPNKPTVNPPPSEWSTAEPSYTSGSTNTLYFVDCTIYSDGTFMYSDVSKSSSYEAAKEAYNEAQAAQDTANTANNKIDAVTTRVTDAETAIEQNKEAIELRATKTEVTETVDAVTTRITEAEAIIKQNSEAIELKVNQSTMNEALENLQIGTRNYIRNSQTMMWNDYVIVSTGDDKTGYVGSAIVGTAELDDGTVITAERLNAIETSNESTVTSITTIKEAMGI